MADDECSASTSGDLRIAEASKYYRRLYLTSVIRADRMFDRCTRGGGGREKERESERGKERKREREREREITRTTWRARLSINFLRISGNRRRLYVPREEFYREFGWHEYRLLIGKVIKRCRGSDYRVRGNYRKGKEERPLARSRPPRPANMNAIDVFGNISRASAKALSPRWIAEMEFALRYFTSCTSERASARALAHHAPINIEDYNPEGRARHRFELCFIHGGSK